MTVHGSGSFLARLRIQKRPFSGPSPFKLLVAPFGDVYQLYPIVVTNIDIQVG